MLRWIAVLSFCMQALSLHAMTVEVIDDKVFASGPVGDTDFISFKAVFENPKITTVVLVNSPGGDLWTGMTIGRLIAAKGYNTVAVGSCMSACSIIFMGGRDRRFGDSLRPAFNVIGIHGPHDTNTKTVSPTQAPQMFAFYKQQMGEKFNGDIMNQALFDMTDAQAFLRIFEATRNDKAQTLHCRSGQMPRNQCTYFKEHNGLTLGVLTHAELASVKLPEKMRALPAVLGIELGGESMPAMADLADALAVIANSKCVSERCKNNAKDFGGLKDDKSIAIRVDKSTHHLGVGFMSGQDAATQALVRAVYGCNHIRDVPVGLCEARFVNHFDVRALYTQSDLEHQQVFEKIKVPQNKFYGNEEFGGGLTAASGYRTQKLNDMTPRDLEGIRTIPTQELVQTMIGDKPPVVIDVQGAFQTIPSSKHIANAGLAFENASRDQLFNGRFVSLLALLAPDKTQSVVFFSSGRESWQSVNASLRAKAAGYTNIWWYRGGLLAWKEAQLPTALVAVRAVAN